MAAYACRTCRAPNSVAKRDRRCATCMQTHDAIFLSLSATSPFEIAAREIEAATGLPRDRWIYATQGSEPRMVEINERHVTRMREIAGVPYMIVSKAMPHEERLAKRRTKKAA